MHIQCTSTTMCFYMCMCVRVHVIDVEESKCPQVALKVVAAAADTVATAASFALEERSLIKIVEWFPRPQHSSVTRLLLSAPKLLLPHRYTHTGNGVHRLTSH